MKVVIDASVAFKWYVPEADADLAHDLVRSQKRLIAPQIILAEVANAGWKLVRKGELDHRQYTRIATILPRPFDEIVPLTALLPRAAAISLALDHPIYDCFYLALSEAHDAPLVTADRRLIAKARASTFRVISLRASKSH